MHPAHYAGRIQTNAWGAEGGGVCNHDEGPDDSTMQTSRNSLGGM